MGLFTLEFTVLRFYWTIGSGNLSLKFDSLFQIFLVITVCTMYIVQGFLHYLQ